MTATVSPTHDDHQTISRLRALWDYTKRQKQTRYRAWERNYMLVNNAYGGSASETWMPAPRASKIYPTLASLIAWMGDQHVTINANAAVNPGDQFADFAQHLANDLATVMTSRWETGQFERQEKLSLWDAFMYGTGILKTAWDDTLWAGLGDFIIRRVDPWSFYPDPKATSNDDAEFFIEVRLMSIDEIERRFPDSSLSIDAKGLGGLTEIPQRPEYGTYSTSNPSVGTLPSTYSGTLQPGGFLNRQGGLVNPTRNIAVYEFWTRENDYEFNVSDNPDNSAYSERQVTDNWTVTCVARGEVLLREQAKDLWSGGWHPYSRYAYDDIGEYWGIALVDHMAFPQMYVNRLLTAMQYNYELTGNPVLLEASSANTERVNWSARPGTRIPVRGSGGMANAPKFLQPPAMPTQVMELLNYWQTDIEDVAGVTNAMKQGQAGGRTTQGVMSAIQESSFVRIRNGLSNFEFTLEDAGQKAAELICENYDQPRVLAITGPQGEQSAIALNTRHFNVPTDEGAAPLNATIIIDAGSEMPTSLQARYAKEEKYYMLKATDRQAFLEGVNYPNRAAVIKRIEEAQQAGTWSEPGQKQKRMASGSAQPAGQGNTPPTGIAG